MSDSSDLAEMRDSIRRVLNDRYPVSVVAAWDKADEAPRGALDPIAALGVCGIAVPEVYGGLGVDIRGVAMVIEELARRSAVLSSMYVMNAIYGSFNLNASGTERQKSLFLPQLAEGRLLFSYGLSEPNVGADLTSVQTRADVQGNQIVITGAKRWCTGADVSDYIFALVRTGNPGDRRKNLSFVLIPTSAPGVHITTTPTMGMKGLSTCDVVLDNVRLPLEESVLGGLEGLNHGWSQLAGPALEAEKLQVPAMAVGIAECAVEEAWNYSQERKQFGVRICAHQSVRHMLVEAKTQLMACRAVLNRCIDLVADDMPSAVETSMAKIFVAETVRQIVLECQRVLGAYGYAEGFQMERLVRDVLVLPIWGGSSAIQRNNLAGLLHLPRE